MALFLGFYFGVLSMVILYNFHWYNVTKEKSYLYYAVFKVIMIFVILQASHIAFINRFSLHLSTTILLIFLLLFSIEFLALKVNFKKTDTAIKYLLYGVVLYFLYGVITDDSTIFDVPYSLLLSPLIVIGYLKYRSGYKPALYYVIAWGISLALIGMSEVNKFNVIEFYPGIPFDLMGHIIESIILSYAIFEKTNLAIKQKEQQEKILIHQAKLASMGQMLENISHQWRQPLNRIATFIINMQIHIKEKYDKETYLLDALNQSQVQLEYMSNTITDFTNFNKQEKDKENFMVSSTIDIVHNIVDKTLEKNNIRFEVKINNDFSIYSYPNELAQVILNLVQNAQDELLKNKVQKPVITIIIDKNIIRIQDNAGSIGANIINHIFEPYFTTKSTSLGLGLYMSKIILEKYFNAKIELDQSQPITSFTLFFH